MAFLWGLVGITVTVYFMPVPARDGSLRRHREPVLPAVLPAVPRAEARDAVVVGDERAAALDRRGDQETVRRIAVLQVVQPVAARGGAEAERGRLHARTAEEARNPFRGSTRC